MRNYFAVNKDYLLYIKDIHVEESFYRGNIGVRKKDVPVQTLLYSITLIIMFM